MLAFLLLALPSWAQAAPRVAPAQFDPSDAYFQGHLARRAAEDLEAAFDFMGASDNLQPARKLFEAVDAYYPGWNTPLFPTLRSDPSTVPRASREKQISNNMRNPSFQ